MTAPRKRARVARDWAAYDAQRARPRLQTCTVSREVHEAVQARIDAGETVSRLVERALRKELGLPAEE